MEQHEFAAAASLLPGGTAAASFSFPLRGEEEDEKKETPTSFALSMLTFVCGNSNCDKAEE